MRHVELVNALQGAGMEIHRGKKIRDGWLFYTVGTERNRVTWTGPRTGDGDVDYVCTSDTQGGIGFSLRSLRLTVCYAMGEIHGWEAACAERCEDLERYEAATSERARNGKKNAGVCTPRTSNPERRRSVAPRA